MIFFPYITLSLLNLLKYYRNICKPTITICWLSFFIIQKPLPRLPVPELNNTLDKYLKLVAPVVSEEDYDRTRQIVEEFRKPGGEGEELQKLLKEFASTKINWVCLFVTSYALTMKHFNIAYKFVSTSK